MHVPVQYHANPHLPADLVPHQDGTRTRDVVCEEGDRSAPADALRPRLQGPGNTTRSARPEAPLDSVTGAPVQLVPALLRGVNDPSARRVGPPALLQATREEQRLRSALHGRSSRFRRRVGIRFPRRTPLHPEPLVAREPVERVCRVQPRLAVMVKGRRLALNSQREEGVPESVDEVVRLARRERLRPEHGVGNRRRPRFIAVYCVHRQHGHLLPMEPDAFRETHYQISCQVVLPARVRLLHAEERGALDTRCPRQHLDASLAIVRRRAVQQVVLRQGQAVQRGFSLGNAPSLERRQRHWLFFQAPRSVCLPFEVGHEVPDLSRPRACAAAATQ